MEPPPLPRPSIFCGRRIGRKKKERNKKGEEANRSLASQAVSTTAYDWLGMEGVLFYLSLGSTKQEPIQTSMLLVII
jgi:hypothetical protein